jgi:hypothetical protein
MNLFTVACKISLTQNTLSFLYLNAAPRYTRTYMISSGTTIIRKMITCMGHREPRDEVVVNYL